MFGGMCGCGKGAVSWLRKGLGDAWKLFGAGCGGKSGGRGGGLGSWGSNDGIFSEESESLELLRRGMPVENML